jgi:hypothetical protein
LDFQKSLDASDRIWYKDHTAKETLMSAAKASARKSLGEFKPLIVYPDGKTEVCEQSPDRQERYTKQGIVRGNRLARGNTYLTKEEAVEAAQIVIDIRREDALRRVKEWSVIPGRESGVEHSRKESILWGANL